MTKLLTAYRAARTFPIAQKVRAYTLKHPMAACMLSFEEANLLKDALAHAVEAHCQRVG